MASMSNNTSQKNRDLTEMQAQIGFGVVGVIIGLVVAFLYLEYLAPYLWQISLKEMIIPYFVWFAFIEIVPLIIACLFLMRWEWVVAYGFVVGAVIMNFLLWNYYAETINFFGDLFL